MAAQGNGRHIAAIDNRTLSRMSQLTNPGVEIVTHLIGTAEPQPGHAAPRVGDPVVLRRAQGGREIEAWSPAGLLLGRLPPAERDALSPLPAGVAPRGRITALVPRPLLAGAGRIHIRVELN